MPRIARGLYATPRERMARPEGGIDLHSLVEHACQVRRFSQLFGETTDVVQLVQRAVQQCGWTLPMAEILEAMEEFA